MWKEKDETRIERTTENHKIKQDITGLCSSIKSDVLENHFFSNNILHLKTIPRVTRRVSYEEPELPTLPAPEFLPFGHCIDFLPAEANPKDISNVCTTNLSDQVTFYPIGLM